MPVGAIGRTLNMAGPSWIAAVLAVVMIATAIYCAGRLAAALLWRRFTEVDTDSVHLVMGVAMAGMLLPRLSPMPGTAWQAVFGAAGAWFAYRAARSRLRRDAAASRWRCSHPLPHLVESAAMVYMLGMLPGSWPGWPGQAMAMPGMGGGTAVAGGSLAALAVILALFTIGYVLWTADQLTTLARAPAVVTEGTPGDQSGIPIIAAGRSGVADIPDATGAVGGVRSGPAYRPGCSALAPRLAACYKIAMSITMGYMLILML
jgi:hypothetical protein